MTDGRPRVGVISSYFSLYDEQMPEGFRGDRGEAAAGYAALLGAEFDVTYAGMLASEADGAAANALLGESDLDVIVFAPAMVAPPSYALAAIAGLDLPIVIWNGPMVDRLPATLSQSDATVNSTQVAAVMFANPLVRRGAAFATVTAAPSDVEGVERLLRTVRGAAAASVVRGATVVRVGGWIDGYADIESDETQHAELGVVEHTIETSALDQKFDSISPDRIASLLDGLTARGWVHHRSGTDAVSARLALALSDIVDDAGAAAVTVNCHSTALRWNPHIGIAACLGASLLTERGVPVSCTGDLPTSLALLLAHTLSRSALYCEFYTPEHETGLMLLAAGGEGDPSWADPAGSVVVEPNEHYPGEVGAGASLSFKLEPGPATVLSLSPTSNGWVLAWATGEIVEARYTGIGGPNGMFRFDSGPAFAAGERWIESGATHHNALARGRLDVELPVLARALGIKEVRV